MLAASPARQSPAHALTLSESTTFDSDQTSPPPVPVEILAAIAAAKSLTALDGCARALWAEWGAGHLTDERASALAEALETRRREIRGADAAASPSLRFARGARERGRASYFPTKRKAVCSPERRASTERRRKLAASGPMPPHLACRFTTGELAALRIVADAVRDRGICVMTLGEIAARAGVCVTTARNALRLAAREGLATIEERRRDKRPNLSNVVRIVSREWRNWIERGRTRKASPPTAAAEGGGCKKAEATDRGSFRTSRGDRLSRDRQHAKALGATPKGAARGA